jgi:bifunctional enzyme CysN/CysC
MAQGSPETNKSENMNIVIAGHVDHGKSTVIGRLLADTGSLPEGKLEQVRETCRRNSRPFEYAFLLDALKDEQSQGITIDSARVFFKTQKRHYIIIDAPGHIEFLKNMVTGASHAEAALLVIDAAEGVQENSRRHGYMISMLGIRQIVVLVNKMDLVDYKQEVFDSIVAEYTEFLDGIDVKAKAFIPVSGTAGDTIAALTDKMPWYSGQTVLESLDNFKKRTAAGGQTVSDAGSGCVQVHQGGRSTPHYRRNCRYRHCQSRRRGHLLPFRQTKHHQIP